MTFANPMLLWLLLVIPPALLLFFWWAWRKRQQLLTQFIAARLMPGLIIGTSAARQKLRAAFVVLASICLILALARPQWGFDWEEVKQRGLDIVVAIDTSKSMLAEDIAPNRLARAKLAALDLMQQAKSDRLGLVAFAGNAFLQCPMTIDDAAFRRSVESLDVNLIPQGGSALAGAIETARSAFKEGDNHKILVLFTDGEDHDPDAAAATTKAAEAGLRIFTIGIGTAEGELLRIKDPKGRTDYIRDAQGNVVKSRLNEALLQEIAGAAGGFYLPLRGAKTIDTLYEKGLAPLPKSESQEKLIQRFHERFHWPLAAAIIFLLAEMLIPERKRIAKSARTAVPEKSIARAAAIGLVMLLPASMLASSSSALREYNAGKYQQALKEYEKLLQGNPEDPRLHFNAGTAAYRAQQYEEAAKRFNEVLTAPDLQLQQQAYYNRGNTWYQLGEQLQDPAKRTETWEKSLKDFQSTLKLNPQDADAKFNYEFVKKRLEELKQQQQQQKKDDKSDENKDQNQQQQQEQARNDQQKQEQQKSGQSKQDQEKKDQEKQGQDQQQQQQASDQSQQQKEQEQKEAQQKEAQKKEAEQKEQQQAQQSSGKPEESEGKKEPGQAYAAGQMTPQQAQQLLDAQKGEEKMLPIKPVTKPADPNRPLRDW